MAQRHRLRNVRYGGWNSGTVNGTIVLEPAIVGVQSCDDETHPGPPYRTGGPLTVSKKIVDFGRTAEFSSNYTAYLPSGYNWKGHMCAVAYTPPTVPTALSLSGWGARGWNRTYPLHPIYNLGVSLAEARDIPRMITQTRHFFASIRNISLTRIPKTIESWLLAFKRGLVEASGDYLNLQFGWVPFLQDLTFIFNMQSKLAKKMAWLKKHNGKSIRRKVTLDAGGFAEDVARNVPPHTTMSPVFISQLYSGNIVNSVPMPVKKVYDRKIWYVAKYRYYIPELASYKPHETIKWAMLGLDLDPSIIYKATPWSWLLDWFTSVGTVLHNIYLRARFHVVAEYAYVMCSEKYTYISAGYADVHTGKYDTVSQSWKGPDRRMSSVSKTYYIFRKREVANPFGFGITFASLSAYQWSILVALGLSRRKTSYAPRT